MRSPFIRRFRNPAVLLGLILGLASISLLTLVKSSRGQVDGIPTAPPSPPPVPALPPESVSPGTSPQSDLNPDVSPQSDINLTDPSPTIETTFSSPPQTTEISFSQAYAAAFGPFYGDVISLGGASTELSQLSNRTKTNQALVYVDSTRQGLKLILVTGNPDGSADNGQANRRDHRYASNGPSVWSPSSTANAQLAQTDEFDDPSRDPNIFVTVVPEATPRKLRRTAKKFRRRVSNSSDVEFNSYLGPSQTLYQWIIQPLKEELEAKDVDTLIFVLDEGVRTIPIAALHDGTQFLVENYNVSVIPSFSLTDTRYRPIQGAKMLGFGITQSVEGLSPLPSVEVEIPTLTTSIWDGRPFLDQNATVDRLQELTQSKEFDIIHLATHAEFNRGQVSNSFIQLWDQRLRFGDLKRISTQARWNEDPTIELLVLSACQTALGSKDAELGFTGLALQTGVKSALGSLWFVSDDGTLALMSEFYSKLESAPIKSAALRNAQLAMINGETRIENGVLTLSDLSEVQLKGRQDADNIKLSHPYYWSPFTLVGNWN